MLIDNFGRKIEYLRVSVTKNCNFRCKYCMPNTPDFIKEDLIPLELMLEFLKIALDHGIKKIRITGGEPLLRADLVPFIKGIYNYKNGVEVALTTNGSLLSKYARGLKDAGLKSINISLDSLSRDKIIQISQKDRFESVLEGIFEAKKCGFKIKLNMVPLKNINDGDIIPLLEFANENGFMLRYIEYMDNQFAASNIEGFRYYELLEIIGKKYKYKMIEKEYFGPAKLYELEDLGCVFGIIAPHSDTFCSSCNRIRLTSDGIIYPCLYFEDSINAKDAIMRNDKEAMKKALLYSIFNKPEKNRWQENIRSNRAFFHTGG